MNIDTAPTSAVNIDGFNLAWLETQLSWWDMGITILGMVYGEPEILVIS